MRIITRLEEKEKKIMEKYESLEIEVIIFETEDVIDSSIDQEASRNELPRF